MGKDGGKGSGDEDGHDLSSVVDGNGHDQGQLTETFDAILMGLRWV